MTHRRTENYSPFLFIMREKSCGIFSDNKSLTNNSTRLAKYEIIATCGVEVSSGKIKRYISRLRYIKEI